MSDFNNFYENPKIYNLEPYVLIDGLTGNTRYTGISLISGIINKPTWRIKKEWIVGNIQYMGFPNGDQSYDFVWSGRTSYTYK
jgi:hypothetical protein